MKVNLHHAFDVQSAKELILLALRCVSHAKLVNLVLTVISVLVDGTGMAVMKMYQSARHVRWENIKTLKDLLLVLNAFLEDIKILKGSLIVPCVILEDIRGSKALLFVSLAMQMKQLAQFLDQPYAVDVLQASMRRTHLHYAKIAIPGNTAMLMLIQQDVSSVQLVSTLEKQLHQIVSHA